MDALAPSLWLSSDLAPFHLCRSAFDGGPYCSWIRCSGFTTATMANHEVARMNALGPGMSIKIILFFSIRLSLSLLNEYDYNADGTLYLDH